MNKQIKLAIGTLVVLLATAFVLWVVYKRRQELPQPVTASGRPSTAIKNPEKAQAPPIPPQPFVASSESSKFGRLAVLKRSAILQEIQKKDLASIFRIWLEAGRVDHDSMKQRAVGTLLGKELRFRPADEKFYSQLHEFIADDSNSSTERGLLLVSIRETRTPESLNLLIQTATTSADKGLKQTAIAAIQTVGNPLGDGRFHEELAPTLEQVWGTAQDQYLLGSVAVAMAEVGSASSIKLLLSAATDTGSQDNVRKQAALIALSETLNSNAVPVLAAVLANQPPTSEASGIASGTLAQMNAPAAAQALLDWLETSDASVAPLAQNYATHTRSQRMLKAYESALNPVVPFRDEQVREAIRTGLEQYHQNRKN